MGRGGGSRGGGYSQPQLSTNDVESFNSIKFLMDKHKALKLTDQQRADFKTANKQMSWNFKKLAAQVDSQQNDASAARGGARGSRDGDGASGGGQTTNRDRRNSR